MGSCVCLCAAQRSQFPARTRPPNGRLHVLNFDVSTLAHTSTLARLRVRFGASRRRRGYLRNVRVVGVCVLIVHHRRLCFKRSANGACTRAARNKSPPPPIRTLRGNEKIDLTGCAQVCAATTRPRRSRAEHVEQAQVQARMCARVGASALISSASNTTQQQ